MRLWDYEGWQTMEQAVTFHTVLYRMTKDPGLWISLGFGVDFEIFPVETFYEVPSTKLSFNLAK